MAKENRAIILAVSHYQNSTALPACKNDGALLRAILHGTGKFAHENTLYIDTDTTSGKIKGDLARFVKDADQKETGELFLYYTGHGLFDGTDFYYLLTDYSQGKLQQTALSNSELDDMLRSLRADLTVKVIDACQSAQQYVKSSEEFEKAVKATVAAFKHCYFMFSSEQMQPSWQDSNLSYFTAAFARSVAQHTSDTIRYKDIIDFISDAFQGSTGQRPVFVTQANYTDEFCPVTDTLRQKIASLLPSTAGTPATLTATTTGGGPPFTGAAEGTVSSGTQAPIPRLSVNELLKERVRKEADEYCTEEGAMRALQIMKQTMDGYALGDALGEFYELRFDYMTDHYSIPNAKAIGEWLKNNPHSYFASVEYASKPYEAEELVPSRKQPLAIADLFPQYRTVTKYRQVVVGFDTTTELPFKAANCLAEPVLQNLPWWKWYCAVILSKVTIRCFFSHVRLSEINWAERKPVDTVEWRTEEFPMKKDEAVRERTSRLLDGFAAVIRSYLLERYHLTGADAAE